MDNQDINQMINQFINGNQDPEVNIDNLQQHINNLGAGGGAGGGGGGAGAGGQVMIDLSRQILDGTIDIGDAVDQVEEIMSAAGMGGLFRAVLGANGIFVQEGIKLGRRNLREMITDKDIDGIREHYASFEDGKIEWYHELLKFRTNCPDKESALICIGALYERWKVEGEKNEDDENFSDIVSRMLLRNLPSIYNESDINKYESYALLISSYASPSFATLFEKMFDTVTYNNNNECLILRFCVLLPIIEKLCGLETLEKIEKQTRSRVRQPTHALYVPTIRYLDLWKRSMGGLEALKLSVGISLPEEFWEEAGWFRRHQEFYEM